MDDDSAIRVTVSKDASGAVQIYALDSSDGEALEVSNIEARQDRLSFCCMVPSTGYCTENQMTLNNDGSCQYRLTLYERWEKICSEAK